MKEQIRYAKINRVALRYVWLLALVVVVLAGVFGGTVYLQSQQAAQVAADVASKQQTIAGLNKTFTPKAKDVSDRLNAIKFVQANQTHFSQLIADIAKVVPKGVSIDSMTLTGNDALPLQIAVTANSYDAALAFRNALVTSPRIAEADLETISANQGGTFQTNVVVAFKKGQAK
jgi:Tfp pilus assembly protein PilN